MTSESNKVHPGDKDEAFIVISSGAKSRAYLGPFIGESEAMEVQDYVIGVRRRGQRGNTQYFRLENENRRKEIVWCNDSGDFVRY